MTAKQAYNAVLIELNKLQAPSILLEDYVYIFNKAINQYINKKYNQYDVNQQSSDDLRVLKATCVLTPVIATDYYEDLDEDDREIMERIYGATYEVDLPDDYLHVLNCVCVFKQVSSKSYNCYSPGGIYEFPASRLTADMWGQVINNFYMKPSYRRPYYYIHNIALVRGEEDDNYSLNPIIYNEDNRYVKGTDMPINNNAHNPQFTFSTYHKLYPAGSQDVPQTLNEMTRVQTVDSLQLDLGDEGFVLYVCLPINRNFETDGYGNIKAYDELGNYTNCYIQPVTCTFDDYNMFKIMPTANGYHTRTFKIK